MVWITVVFDFSFPAGAFAMEEIVLEKRNAIPALGFYPGEPISTGVSDVFQE